MKLAYSCSGILFSSIKKAATWNLKTHSAEWKKSYTKESLFVFYMKWYNKKASNENKILGVSGVVDWVEHKGTSWGYSNSLYLARNLGLHSICMWMIPKLTEYTLNIFAFHDIYIVAQEKKMNPIKY